MPRLLTAAAPIGRRHCPRVSRRSTPPLLLSLLCAGCATSAPTVSTNESPAPGHPAPVSLTAPPPAVGEPSAGRDPSPTASAVEERDAEFSDGRPGAKGARGLDATPAELSPLARQQIATVMRAHSDDMIMLLGATLYLDPAASAYFSHLVDTTPRLAEPLSPSEDTTNASIPPRFFELQDDLRRAARKIKVTSLASSDPVAVAHDYGALLQACVRCHAEYLVPLRERDGQ